MNALLQKFGLDFDFFTGLTVWSLIFIRTFVMLMLVPFLAGKGIAGRFRLLLAGILATFVFYLLGDAAMETLPKDRGVIAALFCKEMFFGLAIGMTTLMCFFAIEAGGRIVDNQRGSANAQIFLPQLGQVSIFGLFQFQLGLTLFLSLSGHLPFLRAYIESFVTVPVTVLPQVAAGFSPFLEFIIRMSADVLLWGMQLAAPVLIAIFLTDLVLGIANKMAPQIPVFELGFLIKGYVGVGMVYVSIVIIISQMEVFFKIMNTNVEKIIVLFAK